jgi:hypothetical protein
MLTDDFLSSLPDDPELGYIALVDHLDEWLKKYNRALSIEAQPSIAGERKYAETSGPSPAHGRLRLGVTDNHFARLLPPQV